MRCVRWRRANARSAAGILRLPPFRPAALCESSPTSCQRAVQKLKSRRRLPRGGMPGVGLRRLGGPEFPCNRQAAKRGVLVGRRRRRLQLRPGTRLWRLRRRPLRSLPRLCAAGAGRRCCALDCDLRWQQAVAEHDYEGWSNCPLPLIDCRSSAVKALHCAVSGLQLSKRRPAQATCNGHQSVDISRPVYPFVADFTFIDIFVAVWHR